MGKVEPVSKEQSEEWYKESLVSLKDSIERLEKNPLLYSENEEFYAKMLKDVRTLRRCRDYMK